MKEFFKKKQWVWKDHENATYFVLYSFFDILGFTCSFTFTGISPTNIISSTTEADTEEFADDVNSKYHVNSVYSNNGDIDINDEESELKDSDNKSVRSEQYSVF